MRKKYIVISDASPIISLAVIQKLDILTKLFDKVYIPNAVWEELVEAKLTEDIAQIKPFFRDKVMRLKSLNYLFYLSAKEWAIGKGGDEAIILNADGTVSEGSTTNIFYVKDGEVYKPISAHYLRGIMEKQVIKFLKTAGVEVKEKETCVEDLLGADEVFWAECRVSYRQSPGPAESREVIVQALELKLLSVIGS